jgi:hypothetical protein
MLGNKEIIGDKGPSAGSDKLPLPGEPVMVVCRQYRCRGYLDGNGTWRYDADDGEIKEPVVAWSEFGS